MGGKRFKKRLAFPQSERKSNTLAFREQAFGEK
jgi:hypothetical protein